jgi:hypothetical protein
MGWFVVTTLQLTTYSGKPNTLVIPLWECTTMHWEWRDGKSSVYTRSPSHRACERGIQAFLGKWNVYFPLPWRLKKWWKNGSVSWAKTCTLVIHIWRVAHKWQGRSSGTRKQWSVAKIHAIDARAGSNRRWCQRLSGYPSLACARGRDRRAVTKASNAASCTVPASDAVELHGRSRAWATDAWCHVCQPCGIHVWWTQAKTSSLDRVYWAYRRVCRPVSDASVATIHDRWFSNELDTWRRTERRTRL